MTKTVSALLRCGIAAALGLLVLMNGQTTLARWAEDRNLHSHVVTAGTLGVTQQNLIVTVARIDFTSTATTVNNLTSRTITDVTSQLNTFQFIPGDEIVVKSTITMTAVGNNLKAELIVDPSGFTSSNGPLATELAVSGNQAFAITPVGASPALVSAGLNKYSITSTYNGASYELQWTLKVRATTDNADRSTNPPGNWWQTQLQGTSTTAKPLGVQLTQVV